MSWSTKSIFYKHQLESLDSSWHLTKASVEEDNPYFLIRNSHLLLTSKKEQLAINTTKEFFLMFRKEKQNL